LGGGFYLLNQPKVLQFRCTAENSKHPLFLHALFAKTAVKAYHCDVVVKCFGQPPCNNQKRHSYVIADSFTDVFDMASDAGESS
jgi:hypothetical protein